MSRTTQAVRNAAAALKKATDPWNKEGRETADRIASAAIAVTDTPSLGQGTLDSLSGLLRRPFAELYLTHPATALRLSAAIFTAILHDKIYQSWTSMDAQSRSKWEQVAVILLAGVQDHVEAHNNERVKIAVAQAYYTIVCNVFFSTSSTIPLSMYSVSLRVSAYSLLSMTADGPVENKNKLRDNKILGGAKLGSVITSTKDYLSLEQLLILLAYLLPPTDGTAAGGAERLGFLRDCFADSTQRGKDLIELLKYVASPDWEITSDKIVDILARDTSVAQPFVMKSFALNMPSNPRLNPANRFYLDKNSVLFNCEDEDGKLEGMHVPYDTMRSVDVSSCGAVIVELSSPPQCHESLQVVSNNSAIKMTILISQNDVEHFVRTLQIRGITTRIKLNGVPIRRVTERTSINISPTRLEFGHSDQNMTSYQRKVKVVEEGVLQASDPGDDIDRNLEVSVNKLQHAPPLLVKERPSSRDLPSVPASAITHETKISHDGGCDHVFPASRGQLSSVHEDPQKRQTTASPTHGPHPSPRGSNPPPLHTPRTPRTSDNCDDGDHIYSAYSPPSGHSHHGRPSDKELSDAIFGASDEELSSLSDTDAIFCAVRPTEEIVQPRRITRNSDGPEHRTRSQRHRHSHLSAKSTSPIPDHSSAQDPAPEQKLAPMVKGLKVLDSQDAMRVKLGLSAAAASKRKKIVLDSEEELEAEGCVPLVMKTSSSVSRSDLGTTKKVSRRKAHGTVTTAQNRIVPLERPKRACVSAKSSTLRANVEPKASPSVGVDQSCPNEVKAENELTGDRRSPDESVFEGQVPLPMEEVKCKRPVTEGDVSITSSKHGQQRKRARLGPESHSSSDKPYRGNKVISGGKPRKVAPSRVQKTYRNRQKVERSSPKRCAKRDVDYDEIPLLKATLNSHTAKERMLPPTKFGNVVSASKATRIKGTNGRTNLSDSPTVGSEPAVEIPDDKKQEKRDRSRLAGVRPVQGPPAEIACDDDDDPIQSFSSSPSELISSAVEKAELQVLAPHETSVHSDCLPMADSLAKSLDIPSSVGATHGIITNTQYDIASKPPACDTISHHTIVEDVNVGAESQATFLAATEHKAQGSSKVTADLDYLDGSTIMADYSELRQTRASCAEPKPIVDTIDLTGDTPSPKRSPISECVEEKVASPHKAPNGSPAPSNDRASEDISSSSLLDIAGTKYRDFEVSLDSSFCLPFAKTSDLQRHPPTSPPPRTKRKSVTFAAPLEEAVEGQLESPTVPAEVEASTTTDECGKLEYLEPAPELVRGNKSSSRVDDLHCLGRRPSIEPRPIPPLPQPTSQLSVTTQPLSLLSSPLALRQSYSHLSGAPLSTAANAKQKRHARDTSLSPPIKAESSARGNYLIPIMAVLDEIHIIVKNNIQARFERFDGHVVELRRQILAQTKADMNALFGEYVAAFNNLVRLEAKYGAFSRRRIAAIAEARNAAAQCLTSVRSQIQMHDRVMQAHARQTFVVDPLPESLQCWLR